MSATAIHPDRQPDDVRGSRNESGHCFLFVHRRATATRLLTNYYDCTGGLRNMNYPLVVVSRPFIHTERAVRGPIRLTSMS